MTGDSAKPSVFQTWMAIIGSIVGSMTAVSVLHKTWIMPAIMQAVAVEVRLQMEEHSRHPHPSSASRMEFDFVKEAITENKGRLQSIDGRLVEVTRALARLEALQK